MHIPNAFFKSNMFPLGLLSGGKIRIRSSNHGKVR